MKVKFYLAMLAAAFLMSNCSQEETLSQTKNSTNTLTAAIESISRSTVSDGGVFSWTESDAIAVGNAEGGYTIFEYSNEAFTAQTAIVPTGYAVYPYNEAYASLPQTGLPAITLSSEYAYGSTNAPMLATIEEGATSLEFKHLAGVMRFRVKNVPETVSSFILTADKGITGEFTPSTENSETSIQAGTVGSNNKVTITFTDTEVEDVMDFYVPMPVGEYTSLKVKVGEKELASKAGVTNVITRGKLLLMPTMVYDETEGLILEGGNSVSLSSEEEITLDVNGGETVVVEIADGATATLNLIAPENATEGLTISDGSANTESSETSAATLNIATTNVPTLNINTPTLTIRLTSGSYNRVEALTAQQTLIIGEGVTIGELVLNGGNVKLEGDLVLNAPLNIKNGLTTTIDLNGHSITGTDKNTTGNFYLINNTGSLTITGNGNIQLKAQTDREVSASSVVVANNPGGNLTIESGVVIEHLGGTYMAYGVDNLTNGKGTSAITTINGASIKSTYRAVRQFLNGIEATNELYVKAGSILEGVNKSIFFHDPSANANTGKLVVEAGAKLKGDVYLFVTAGSTEWPVEVSIAGAAFVGESTVTYKNVPNGYLVTSQNDVWTILEGVEVTTQDALATAIANGTTKIALTPGEYEIPTGATGKTLKFIGRGNPEDVKIAINSVNHNLSGSTVTFENICINSSSDTYYGYASCEATYKNCVINGTIWLYGNSAFENCTFNTSGDNYNIWTWGAQNMMFEGCTFNSDGKALLLYTEGDITVNLTMTKCVFNDNGGLTSKKAAIEIGDSPYDKKPTYNLIVNNTTVNGYEINDAGFCTNTTLWGNKSSMPVERLNVIVDGVDVY